MLDTGNELLGFTFLDNFQGAVADRHVQFARGEGADKDKLFSRSG